MVTARPRGRKVSRPIAVEHCAHDSRGPRLAIACAILRNPPFLILDEATSALDYQSERLIQEALDRLAAGRNVITIAHRLSTIRNASRIIVLEAGRIIEEGDFRTLVARGGPFARMVATQNTGDDFLQL